MRTIGQLLGERVRHFRERAGLRQEDLAGRTRDLGHPMNRVTIAKIEGAARPNAKSADRTRADNATVVDLLVLAAALDVPPVLLLVPLGEDERAVPIGEVSVPPHLFVEWICGEASLTTSQQEDGNERLLAVPNDQERLMAWNLNRQPLELFRRYRELERDADLWERRLESAADNPDLEHRARGEFDNALRILESHLMTMSRLGLTELPQMPKRWSWRLLEQSKGWETS